MISHNNIKCGHEKRIREEIVSELNEYFSMSKKQKPDNINDYILEQTKIVLEKLYEHEEELELENVNPKTASKYFYIDAIGEYSNIIYEYSFLDI